MRDVSRYLGVLFCAMLFVSSIWFFSTLHGEPNLALLNAETLPTESHALAQAFWIISLVGVIVSYFIFSSLNKSIKEEEYKKWKADLNKSRKTR